MFKRKTPVHHYPTIYEPIVGAESLGEKTLDESQDNLRDDASFTSSISNYDEETIDYQAVYALFVFIATVEGQISVIRGEKLKLLDDTNAYWWLVKVVKTSEIGYIPAENIETPFERLARFNKYKNTKINLSPHPEPIIKRSRPSTKKVSMAKNVSVQSKVLLTDVYNNLISEHFEEQRSCIDDPLLKKQQGIFNQPPTRLSNHALSLNLTQHFMQNRGARPLPLSSSTTSNRLQSTQPKIDHLAYSGTVSRNSTKEHISVLRVFAGNISVKATFNSVLVNENTTAEQLLVLSLERFRLLDNQRQHRCDGVEYYISVKVSDGDEINLSPQDKPLAMFHSLNAHLTTPMPSLTHIRSKVQLTRIGVTKSESNNNIDASFGQNSVTRFSLNKRIKRINEHDGHLRIKIAYYDEESAKQISTPSITTTTTPANSSASRFSRLYHRGDAHHQRRPNQTTLSSAPSQPLSTRIEKLIAVPGRMVVNDLIQLALEKFHIQQNLGTSDDEGGKMNMYGMALVLQGKEHFLGENRSIMDIMNDKQLITNGNHDGILFTLKKMTLSPTSSPASSSSLSTTEKQENGKGTSATMMNGPALQRPAADTRTTHDFGNSDISLTSTSSSTSSDSSRSLASPDSTTHHANTAQHVKLTTDALLQHIDMTLSNLEQNHSVVSGAIIDASSIGSTYMSDLLNR